MTTVSDPTDSALVDAIKGGDRQAESILYDRYRRAVVVWVTARTGSPHAEDYYQEAYTKVFVPAVKAGKLADIRSHAALLRTLTLRMGYRQRPPDEVSVPDLTRWESMLQDENDAEAIKLRRIREEAAQEEVRFLREVLEEDCSPTEKALHQAYWVEGRELKELAEEEGLAEGALRKRHSRMLIRIRQGMCDRLWQSISERSDIEGTDPESVIEYLREMGLVGTQELKILQIRYLGRRPWDHVGRKVGLTNRELAEFTLALMRRLRRAA